MKKKNKITKLAVISVDSHSLPLRVGVIGISTGFLWLRTIG